MSTPPAGATELVKRAPRVYVGPAAERSLRGEAGVLLGARRPDWIDVLEFDPHPGLQLQGLVNLRFAAYDREVMGLSLPFVDFRRSQARLLRDLVPGDVVITERGASVHTGLRFVPARVVGRKGAR